MPSKTEEYLALAQRTANGSDPVLGKLDGLSDHSIPAVQVQFPGPVDDLRSATRMPQPAPTYDIWNNRMNRYVRRGCQGHRPVGRIQRIPASALCV